jgi:superkiller protein 3
MGDLWMQVLPSDRQGFLTLQRDFRRKWAAEDAVGCESLLERDPNNTALHDDAAVLYLELGQSKQAVHHFEASARFRPDSPDALFNLATALMVDGRLDEAVRLYEQVLTVNPAFAAAHTNLGNVLSLRGNLQGAITQYQQALRLQPDNALAHNNLGNAMMSIGKLDQALDQFHEALRLDPRLPDAHYNAALVLEHTGQPSQAIRELKIAIDLSSDPRLAMTDLAWILATSRDDRLRDGREAVRLAEEATALSQGSAPHTLDVLAAAYAAAGRFDEAIVTVQRAIALNPPPPVIQQLRNRKSLYEMHAPYLEPPD